MNTMFTKFLSKKKLLFLVQVALLSLFLVLIATPAFAQLRGGDLLQKSIDAAAVSETAMDDMWTDLFSADSLLYNQLVETATIIQIIAFPFVMLAFGHAAREQNAAKCGEIIAWVLVIFILLDDQGAMLKQVTKGTREIINREAIALLQVQVDDLTIRDAMRDVILTEQLRGRVRDSYTECEAKEGEAQILCMSEAADAAEELIKEYENKGWLYPGIKRYIASMREIRKNFEAAKETIPEDGYKERRDALNKKIAEENALILHSLSGAGNSALLKSYQNWFTYGFEFALMLTGMLGPLAVAASLIPKSPRAVFSWLIGMISIGTLKLSYNLVVGFASLYASKASLVEAGSAGFLTMVSIGAPFIAVAVAGGGGAAVFFALGKTTAMVATIIPVGGSMASGAISAVTPSR